MTSVPLESWDSGHLTINRHFADILRANGLTSFSRIWEIPGGSIAKNLLAERTTTRIELDDGECKRAFYIKRHSRPPLKEFIKPILRLTRPIVGARTEWQALLDFHESGIPTMVPVAFGQAQGVSFVLTEGLEGFESLANLSARQRETGAAVSRDQFQQIVVNVASVARSMHFAQIHHQDFYLHHLLVPRNDPTQSVVVIDLGRARKLRRLSRRWQVKDLGQLSFAAELATAADRVRFLQLYLGRSLCRADRTLIHRIERKADAIRRHTLRHSL